MRFLIIFFTLKFKQKKSIHKDARNEKMIKQIIKHTHKVNNKKESKII